MPDRSPLRYRELLRRLSHFGVEEKRHGSGSVRILYKADVEGQKQSIPIKVRIDTHSDHSEVYVPVIN